MLDGVTIDDPASTYVDWGVTVGCDTVLRPQTMLTGATIIGAGCTVGPGCFLADVTVDDGAAIISSHLIGCHVGPGASVGPLHPRAARHRAWAELAGRAASSRSRRAAWARAARCRT